MSRCPSGRSGNDMYFVYILRSEKNGRYYIGSTNDIGRRLSEHNLGQTKSLKHIRPLNLVFKKEFSSAGKARKVERRLKNFKSKIIIEQIIKDKDIKMGL